MHVRQKMYTRRSWTRWKVPVHAYHWGSDEDNPYRGYLAIADQFVVTGESMSMLAEAAAANRPLYIFDLSDNPTDKDEFGEALVDYPA